MNMYFRCRRRTAVTTIHRSHQNSEIGQDVRQFQFSVNLWVRRDRKSSRSKFGWVILRIRFFYEKLQEQKFSCPKKKIH